VSPRRTLALAAAILALGGGGVLLVWLLDGGAGARPVAGDVPPPPGASAPTAAAGDRAEPPPAAAVATAAATPAAEPSGPDPWSSVLAVHRASELGRELAAPVSDALDEASNRMDYCYEEERRRMADARPLPPGQAGGGPAILVLRLEGAAGRLVVVGTEIETLGHSSRAFAECCERAMQGFELVAPAAKAGQRIRYKMLLQ
jgi:hypothetical protein